MLQTGVDGIDLHKCLHCQMRDDTIRVRQSPRVFLFVPGERPGVNRPVPSPSDGGLTPPRSPDQDLRVPTTSSPLVLPPCAPSPQPPPQRLADCCRRALKRSATNALVDLRLAIRCRADDMFTQIGVNQKRTKRGFESIPIGFRRVHTAAMREFTEAVRSFASATRPSAI